MKNLKIIFTILALVSSYLVLGDPNADLIDAIKNKNTDALKTAIENGADVNQTFEHTLINWQLGAYQTFKKFTPLMLAAFDGYYDGVLHLLHAKAKANTKANGGVGAYFNQFPLKNIKSVTALHLAAGNGHLEVVKLMMQAKAHKTLVIMEVNANQSSIRKVDFVKGTANYTPKKWAEKNGHGEIVALWKESRKAEWAKAGLPSVD